MGNEPVTAQGGCAVGGAGAAVQPPFTSQTPPAIGGGAQQGNVRCAVGGVAVGGTATTTQNT